MPRSYVALFVRRSCACNAALTCCPTFESSFGTSLPVKFNSVENWSIQYCSNMSRSFGIIASCSVCTPMSKPCRHTSRIQSYSAPASFSWIGWNPERFMAKLRSNEWDCEIALRALVANIERSLNEIRSNDLVSPMNWLSRRNERFCA